MSYTTGNDFNLLQATNPGSVGAGLGDDTYILHADLLRPGHKITISDAQGNNVLHLAEGLSIAKSIVAPNSVQLTLSNGAVITVLNSASFTFIAGGEIPISDVAPQTFRSFVLDTLKISHFPAAGEILTGTAQTISSDGQGGGDPDPDPDVGGVIDRLKEDYGVVNSTVSAISTSSTPGVQYLLSGYTWGSNKGTVTYSFNTSGDVYKSYNDPELVNEWAPYNQVEKNITYRILSELNATLNLTFTEVASNGDLRMNTVSMSDAAGFAYYPGNSDLAGDIWLDNNMRSEPGYYDAHGYGPKVIAHEIGHALGLEHTFEPPPMPTQWDNLQYSVMTYNSNIGVYTFEVEYDSSNRSWSGGWIGRYPGSFSILDVQALHAMYGANLTNQTGDNTYLLNPDQQIQWTIWDAGGEDTLDASLVAGNCQINLQDGTLSSIGLKTVEDLINNTIRSMVLQGANEQTVSTWVRNVYASIDSEFLYTGENNLGIVKGCVIENVITSSGDDIVYDNSVNNRISTGSGNDQIHLGRGGFDWVDAGDGLDTLFLDMWQSSVKTLKADDGSWLIEGNNFAAQLIGVEQIQFLDTLYSLA